MAFIAMGGAIAAMAAAIVYLWRQQVKNYKDTEKRFQKIDEELKQAIRERCIRGGGEPRPCLNRFCISDEHPSKTGALEKKHG